MSKSTNKIDRSTAEYYYGMLSDVLYDFTANMELLGSYRRQKDLLGDLDVIIELLPHVTPADVRDALRFSLFEFVSGKDKHLTVTIDDTQIDIYLASADHWAPFQLFLTGSGNHNVRMRMRSKKLGFKLNQYGLWNDGMRIDSNTEQSIYDILGYQYLEPPLRERENLKH